MTREQKKRIFDIIQIGERTDFASRNFDVFITLGIVANIAVLFLSTFDSLAAYRGLFDVIEWITILIFCVEYLLRIWTADLLYPHLPRRKAVLKFMFSFDGVVDLLTILPFFFLMGASAFRMLRVVRIFHLFRINAYYDSFNVITEVLADKKNQIISSIFIILVLMLASSLSIYSAEHEAQPQAFPNALSGIWWSVSTIFTVGYGDIYPVTSLGRVMAVIITFLGVGVVAIPTGIISAGFVEHYQTMQRKNKVAMENRRTVCVDVDKASPYLGMRVREIEEKIGVDIAVIVRDGSVMVPAGSMKVKVGDSLLYLNSRIG